MEDGEILVTQEEWDIEKHRGPQGVVFTGSIDEEESVNFDRWAQEALRSESIAEAVVALRPTQLKALRAGPKRFSSLMRTAASGAAAVDALLDDPEKLFERDHRGRTALDWARGQGGIEIQLHDAMVKQLRKRSMLLRAQEEEKRLVDLVEKNDRLRQLLELEIGRRDVLGLSKIVDSATFSRADYVRACKDLTLLAREHGGEETTSNNYFLDLVTRKGGTPLLLACAADDEKLTETLLDRGCDANHENQRGHTPLTWAAVCGSLASVEMLLQHPEGATVSYATKAEGRTALLHAAHHGRADVLKILIDRLYLDAQSRRSSAMDGRPESRAELVRKNWMRDYFEVVILAKDPWSKLTPLELARSRDMKEAVVVLEAAELKCSHFRAVLANRDAVLGCPRCGLETRKDTLTAHMLNDCELRPRGCELCGAAFPLRDMERHLSAECPEREVVCGLCDAKVAAKQFEAHEKFRCPKRLVKCRQGCDVKEMAAEVLSVHEMQRCLCRPLPCPNTPSCGQDVAAGNLKKHARLECPSRLTKCKICHTLVEFCRLEQHETEICVQPCQWDGCGLRIGPAERRLMHEQSVCGRRPIECKHSCGITVSADTMWAHVELSCPLRPTKCPLGCLWRGGFAELKEHLDAEKGACEERQRRCRFDLLNRRVLFGSPSSGKTEYATLRKFDGGKFLLFPTSRSPFWTTLSELKGLVLVDGAGWKCGWVNCGSMPEHLAECQCKPIMSKQPAVEEEAALVVVEEAPKERRELRCRFGCNQGFPFCSLKEQDKAESLKRRHEIDKCPKRFVTCEGCGDSELWAEELAEHIRETCPVLSRPKTAPGFTCCCGAYVAHLEEHEHALECLGKECYCPSGCGLKMTQKDLEEHLEVDCPRKLLKHGLLVSCPLGCGKEAMRSQDEWAHVNSECPRRVVQCTECEQQFIFAEQSDHDSICEMRIIPCGAGAQGCERQQRSWFSSSNTLVRCDIHGATLLLYAVRCREVRLMEHVLQIVDEDQLAFEARDGHSALTKACELDSVEMVERLWRAGGNLNAETARGRTPLIEAAKAGCQATSRFLVDHGAVIDHRPVKMKRTALEWARQMDHFDLKTQLRRDLDVANDMASLFALVTTSGADNVLAVVQYGDPHKRGALPVLLRELADEDSKLKEAVADLAELKRLRRSLKIARIEAEKILNTKLAVAGALEDAADRALETREAFKKKVDDQLRAAFVGLDTLENADMVEMHSLAAKAVPARVLAVLQAATDLLEIMPGKERNLDYSTWKGARKILARKDLMRDLRYFSTKGAQIIEKEDLEELLDRLRPPSLEKSSLKVAEVKITEEEEEEGDGLLIQRVDHAVNAAIVAYSRPPIFEEEAGEEDYALAGVLAAWVNAQVDAIGGAAHMAELAAAELAVRLVYDEQRHPARKMALKLHQVAVSRSEMLETELEAAEKHLAHSERRVLAWERKCRVSRVLQTYTPTGHSLITWSAANGLTSVVDVLLDHGSAPGLPDAVEAQAASIIKFVWRHKRWRVAASLLADNVSERSRRRLQEVTHHLALARLLRLFEDARKAHRIPLCEAAYSKHHAIFDSFEKRKRLNFGDRALFETFCRPQPPFPFSLRRKGSGRYNVQECAELGSRELSGSSWQHGCGWISASDSRTPQQRTKVWAAKCLKEQEKCAAEGRTMKFKRLDNRAASERLATATEALEEAMRRRDWAAMAVLFDDGCVAVDHEHNGRTALLTAACEDANDDELTARDVEGNLVLAVVLLLDRKKRRPLVDRENKFGETALSTACAKGRRRVIAALLERGADLHRESTALGKTPLRFAAENDRLQTVAMLLERGAQTAQKAHDGSTALDAARLLGAVDTENLLRRYHRGGAGQLSGAKGQADPLLPCGFGCGLFFAEGPKRAHEAAECPKRAVDCPYKCGQEDQLWAEELAAHVQSQCVVGRFVKCPLNYCEESVRVCDLPRHTSVECVHRTEPCPGCGLATLSTRLKEHERHFCPARPQRQLVLAQKNERRECLYCNGSYAASAISPPSRHGCPAWVPTKCPNKCSLARVPARELAYHLEEACDNRWIECPRQCGLKIRHRDQDSAHESSCTRAAAACDHCGREIKPRSQLEVHRTVECPSRPVDCAACGLEMKFSELRDHKTHECAGRTADCPNFGCWLKLPSSEVAEHALKECRKRVVLCTLGCGARLPLKKLNIHVEGKCTLRPLECTLGCGSSVRAKDEWNHLNNVCVRRFASGFKQDA